MTNTSVPMPDLGLAANHAYLEKAPSEPDYTLSRIAGLKERIASLERGEGNTERVSFIPDHMRAGLESMKSLSPAAKARIINDEHDRRFRAQQIRDLKIDLEHWLKQKLSLGLL